MEVRMHEGQRKRVWAAAKLAGLITLAVRSEDRALLVEVDEDAEVVRLTVRRATEVGWVTVSEQTTDTLCALEVVDELPVLGDRVGPGLARARDRRRVVTESGVLPAVVLDERVAS